MLIVNKWIRNDKKYKFDIVEGSCFLFTREKLLFFQDIQKYVGQTAII